jgi:hypothetical protein
MTIRKNNSDLVYSYLVLRKAVGWIGILLPFVLMCGVSLIFKGDIKLQNISMYYYTGMRDVFVGALCAIGLFLFFYKGYDKWDDWAGNIAGFCAFCIAWFPTTKTMPLDLSGYIHFIAASIFFLDLAGFSLFLFTREGEKSTKQKLKRNKIYIICGLVIIVCLIAMTMYFSFLQESYLKSRFVYWCETSALVTFGISWLTKGGTLYPDKKHESKVT